MGKWNTQKKQGKPKRGPRPPQEGHRPTQSPFQTLCKDLHGLLRMIHHAGNFSGSDLPKAFQTRIKELGTFLKPARPSATLEDDLMQLAQAWGFQVQDRLLAHYAEELAKLETAVQNTRVSDEEFSSAAQVALGWGKARMRRKLTQTTKAIFASAVEELTPSASPSRHAPASSPGPPSSPDPGKTNSLSTDSPSPAHITPATPERQEVPRYIPPYRRASDSPHSSAPSSPEVIQDTPDIINPLSSPPLPKPTTVTGTPQPKAKPETTNQGQYPTNTGPSPRAGTSHESSGYQPRTENTSDRQAGSTLRTPPSEKKTKAKPPHVSPTPTQEQYPTQSGLLPTKGMPHVNSGHQQGMGNHLERDNKNQPTSPAKRAAGTPMAPPPPRRDQLPTIPPCITPTAVFSPRRTRSSTSYNQPGSPARANVHRAGNPELKKQWTAPTPAQDTDTLVLGTSNMQSITKKPRRDMEIHSYPGCRLHHMEHMLQGPPIHSPRQVIIAMGINDTSTRWPHNTLTNAVKRMVTMAKRKYPQSRVYMAEINYSHTLEAPRQDIADAINQSLNQCTTGTCKVLKALPSSKISISPTDTYGVHWTKESANAVLAHWASSLN